MKEITSEKILEGIFENDSSIIQFVYEKYFNSIKSYITKHGGTEEDAWDIFQDGIVIIYEQIKNKNLVIQSTFITYFFTICKYQWLKVIREKSKNKYVVIDENIEAERLSHMQQQWNMDELIEKEKRVKLYQKHYSKLSKSCQDFLALEAKGMTVKEIRTTLNYKSTGFTYKKRRICKERLINLIKNDSYY